jgi:putative oxidoreductase
MTATANVSTAKPSKTLNILLWISQIILAGAFGMAGISKTFLPIPDLAAQMVWPGDIPAALVRFIGISEFLAAVGLIFPSALRIKPQLTVWAAIGLVIVMILALIFHITRSEMFAIPINLGFALLAGFVAWGRNKKRVIESRQY